MLDRKQTILFFVFLIGSTALILFSFSGDWDGGLYKEVDLDQPPVKAMQESYFKEVNYFTLKDQEPFFTLEASELTMDSTNKKTFFFEPVGFAYSDQGKKLNYKGTKGIYDQKNEILTIDQEASLSLPDTTANADKMVYQVKKDRIHLIGNVKTKTFYQGEGDWIFMDAEEAYFWPESRRSRYLGNVEGLIKRKRVYEDSLEYSANEIYLNMDKLKADLNRDVTMKKQNLRATSRRGEIFLENYNKKLKYFVLYDDVKVTEKVMLDGKLIERRAFSEKLEGLPSENKIVLTGYPKVYQLKDVIKGNKIVLRENTEVVEVDDANTKFKVE